MKGFIPAKTPTRIVVWDIYCEDGDGMLSHHYRSEDRDEAKRVMKKAPRSDGENYAIKLSHKHIAPLV